MNNDIFKSTQVLARAALKQIQDPMVTPSISTGFHNLDVISGGLHRGSLMMLGGRPSMGKTAFEPFDIPESVHIGRVISKRILWRI